MIAEQSDSECVDDDEAGGSEEEGGGTEEELEQNDGRPSFSGWSNEESDGKRSRSDGDTIGDSPALQRLAALERTIAEQSDSEGVDDDEAGGSEEEGGGTEEELEQNDESGMEGSSFGGVGGAILANDDDQWNDGRPYFSCWTQRGNWTLHGYTWWRATFPSSTVLERVTECLRANAWCYSMDLTLVCIACTPARLVPHTPRYSHPQHSRRACEEMRGYVAMRLHWADGRQPPARSSATP
jgi:hypothetical protein